MPDRERKEKSRHKRTKHTRPRATCCQLLKRMFSLATHVVLNLPVPQPGAANPRRRLLEAVDKPHCNISSHAARSHADHWKPHPHSIPHLPNFARTRIALLLVGEAFRSGVSGQGRGGRGVNRPCNMSSSVSQQAASESYVAHVIKPLHALGAQVDVLFTVSRCEQGGGTEDQVLRLLSKWVGERRVVATKVVAVNGVGDGWYHGYRLLEEHMQASGVMYDFVFQSRHDIVLEWPLLKFPANFSKLLFQSRPGWTRWDSNSVSGLPADYRASASDADRASPPLFPTRLDPIARWDCSRIRGEMGSEQAMALGWEGMPDRLLGSACSKRLCDLKAGDLMLWVPRSHLLGVIRHLGDDHRFEANDEPIQGEEIAVKVGHYQHKWERPQRWEMSSSRYTHGFIEHFVLGKGWWTAVDFDRGYDAANIGFMWPHYEWEEQPQYWRYTRSPLQGDCNPHCICELHSDPDGNPHCKISDR